VVVTLVDLTDRIKAEEADSRLAAIVESSDDAIFSKDLEGTIISWNQGAERIYGYRAKEIVGQKVTRLEPDDRVGEMDRLLNKLKNGKRLTQLETKRRRVDGRIIDVSVTISPIRDHLGSIVGASSVARDITGRKVLEKKLQRSIELEQARSSELQTLLEAVPAAVLTSHDRDCKVITGNRAAYELLRIPQGENTSKSNPEAPVRHFRVLHGGRELAPDQLPIQRAAASGEASRDFEEEVVFDDGDKVMLYGNAVPLLDQEGNPAGAVAAFVEITQRVQAEEELRRARMAADAANRAKSLFLANMSHEIRTPLTGVLGTLDLLADTNLDDEQRKLQQMAAESGTTLMKLISDILDFSKIEAGQLSFEHSRFNLRSCVLEATRIVSFESANKDLPIKTDCPDEFDLTVRGDCQRLHQVLFNLIGNAIKFTRKGEIKISLRAEPVAEAKHQGRRMFRFEVSDTGIGIPQKRQAKIFETFTQGDSSTSRNFGGTGLGLAISKALVEGMGGEIGVHSKSGKGSTFSFTLPLEVVSKVRKPATSGTVDSQAAAPADDRRRIKVLVVEDEPTLRGLMEMIFRQRQQDAVVVSSGEQAIAAWEKGDFDIILMDVQMPGMDGIETVKLIRKLEQDKGVAKPIPVVALTAHALKEDLDRCIAAGMNDYISKPININALFELIDKQVDN